MRSSLPRGSTWMAILIYSTLFAIASASHVLSLRDQTCSDGGVCLDIDGNVCCSGGNSGTNGCMFSSGVCCGNGFWCYEGQFCSTTDPSANEDGAVSCCSDAACSNVVGGGLFLLFYSEQPGYTGSSGAAASTSTPVQMQTGSSSTPVNVPVTSSGSSPAGSTQSSVSTKEASATTKAPSSTPWTPPSATSSASPTASKTSGEDLSRKLDLVGGLILPLGMMIVAVF